MKRHPYRFPCLVAQLLLGLIVAAFASAQSASSSGPQHTQNLKLDHFWCYIISVGTSPSVSANLQDQFQTASNVLVGTPLQFCNPVQKTVGSTVTPIVNVNDHLTMYNIPNTPLPASQTLTATNQFGSQQLTVDSATTLMVPTQKLLERLRFPTRLDHFLCYDVSAAAPNATVSLQDQFQAQADITLGKPVLFCNPVAKSIAGRKTTRIQNPAAHLLCYNVNSQSTNPTQVPIQNQLENDTLTVTATQMLCAPSTKTLP